MAIPTLERTSLGNLLSGSWVITRIATGEVIGEFYNRETVENFDNDEWLIETAAQYLGRINATSVS